MSQKRTHDVQVGVPMPLLYAMLLPVFLFLLPFIVAACKVSGVRVAPTLRTLRELFSSLRGAHVEVAMSRYCFLFLVV